MSLVDTIICTRMEEQDAFKDNIVTGQSDHSDLFEANYLIENNHKSLEEIAEHEIIFGNLLNDNIPSINNDPCVELFDTKIISQYNTVQEEDCLSELPDLNYDNFDKDLSYRLNESDYTICELVQDEWTQSNQTKFASPVNQVKKEEIEELRVSTPNRKGHHVSFPEDKRIITAFLPPLVPWTLKALGNTVDLVSAYSMSCCKYNIVVSNQILLQLQMITDFEERFNNLNLSNIQLDWRQCEALEEIFKRVQFKTITLDQSCVDDESSTIFFELIRYYESCIDLILHNDNNFGFFGWETCGRYMLHSTCLQQFKVVNSPICEQAISYLQKGVQFSGSLQILHLEGSIKSGRMLHLLSSAAEQCKSLKELNLRGNKLMPSDGTHLSYIILQNKSLETLDVRRNNLQDSGVHYICNVFCPTTSLKHLDLGDNALTDSCAPSLVSMLKVTLSLKFLALSNNDISDKGTLLIVGGLLSNTSLLHLDLSSTKITCKSVMALAEDVYKGRIEMSKIDLENNNIHEEVLANFKNIMLQNSSKKKMENDILTLEDLTINRLEDDTATPDIKMTEKIEEIEADKMDINIKVLSVCQACLADEKLKAANQLAMEMEAKTNMALISGLNENSLTVKSNVEKMIGCVGDVQFESSPVIKKRKFAVSKSKIDTVSLS